MRSSKAESSFFSVSVQLHCAYSCLFKFGVASAFFTVLERLLRTVVEDKMCVRVVLLAVICALFITFFILFLFWTVLSSVPLASVLTVVGFCASILFVDALVFKDVLAFFLSIINFSATFSAFL